MADDYLKSLTEGLAVSAPATGQDTPPISPISPDPNTNSMQVDATSSLDPPLSEDDNAKSPAATTLQETLLQKLAKDIQKAASAEVEEQVRHACFSV
jgi:hypothetical protein